MAESAGHHARSSVLDIRFPTSRNLDGSDAMNPDPDYSAAYVIVRTTRSDGLEGHGLTFTIGRGTEVVRGRRRGAPAARRGPSTSTSSFADMGAFWRTLVGDSQLRWIGPEKGVIHLATAAVVNAVWDLFAKTRGQAALEAARRHDARGARRARRLPLHHRRPHAGARRWRCCARWPRAAPSARPSSGATATRPTRPRSAGSATTTTRSGGSAARRSPRAGRAFKLKVGADVDDDLRRARDRPRGDRARPDAGGRREPALGRRRGDRLDGAARASSTRTGSRSRPAPTTSSATRRSPAAVAPIRVATGEHVHNRVMFKQLLQAEAIGVCQIDACRLGGVNEVLAVLLHGGRVRRAGLPARRRRRAVRARPAPVGHRLRLRVSGSLEGRMIEYVDHLHEHFVDPVVIRDGALRRAVAAGVQRGDPAGVAGAVPVPGRRRVAGDRGRGRGGGGFVGGGGAAR